MESVGLADVHSLKPQVSVWRVETELIYTAEHVEVAWRALQKMSSAVSLMGMAGPFRECTDQAASCFSFLVQVEARGRRRLSRSVRGCRVVV